ncbi:MAG: MBL fold metallo-hydrolase [Anaerolineae bacterium]|nr:MBL fold metallo-hydrolase [Anaerolineae bacterium]
MCLASCTSLATPAVVPASPTITAVAPSPTETPLATVAPTIIATPIPLPPTQTLTPPATPTVEARTSFTLTVVYDNVAGDARLRTDWGFACLVQGPAQTLLFDTGRNGEILLENMRTLGLNPQAISAIVLSHAHNDHTGGLARFLAENPRVTVYMLASFPAGIKTTVREAGATLVEIEGPMSLNSWAYSTGNLGGSVPEQALVVESPRGAVVVSGCAHPGITTAVRQAQSLVNRDTYLVLGGLHLVDANTAHIAAVIAELQALGVQSVAPSHCTGAKAMSAFAEAFGAAYRSSGVGKSFVIAPEGEP